MKLLSAFFLMLVASAFGSAQSTPQAGPSAPPSVNVLEVSWRKEVFIPALYDDPMRVNQDRDDLERDRKATAVENSTRAKQGQTALPTPSKKIASNAPIGSTPMGVPIGDEPAGNRNLPAQDDPGTSKVYYLYKAKIKNIGEKDIRTIRWQYLLSDSSTGEIVGRHSFVTPVNLRVGKTADLIGKSRTMPARVVDAKNSNADPHGKYIERVTVEAIEYVDGSSWSAP